MAPYWPTVSTAVSATEQSDNGALVADHHVARRLTATIRYHDKTVEKNGILRGEQTEFCRVPFHTSTPIDHRVERLCVPQLCCAVLISVVLP